MALPSDFSKIFGSTATGGLTPISAVNYAKGWEYVGANPPTKNDFSYLQNLSDLKAQWLYNYLTTATNAASRVVGTSPGNIPDMSSFPSAFIPNVNMWFKEPGGSIVQSGQAIVNGGPSVTVIGLPVPFASAGMSISITHQNNAQPGIAPIFMAYFINNSSIGVLTNQSTGTFGIFWSVTGV